MTGVGGVALGLFLAIYVPLAAIYGRSLAGRVHAQARRYERSAVSIMAPKLVLPAIVTLTVVFRFSGPDLDEWLDTTSSGTLRVGMSILWFIGSLFGILFFVAIPFVFGRVFAFVAVLAGWFQHVQDEPLRFGASGFRERAARADAEDENG